MKALTNYTCNVHTTCTLNSSHTHPLTQRYISEDCVGGESSSTSVVFSCSESDNLLLSFSVSGGTVLSDANVGHMISNGCILQTAAALCQHPFLKAGSLMKYAEEHHAHAIDLSQPHLFRESAHYFFLWQLSECFVGRNRCEHRRGHCGVN